MPNLDRVTGPSERARLIDALRDERRTALAAEAGVVDPDLRDLSPPGRRARTAAGLDSAGTCDGR